ncbi:MICOS complex subunit Mic27 [Holothuria leucospilota]|uniref:MICOS complex subunit n=1 Tax=Holothuria leucospilota TaxID=206669 RepID=A0A9Q1BDD2_HOLLE|nr:MICOS complex subunit Mic27 [Holothuria leucospilota]
MFRVVKLVTLGSAPVLTFGLVKAETHDAATPTSHLIKPKDLPLYPVEGQAAAEWELVPENRESNALENSFAVVRRQIWKWSDSFQGAVDTTKNVYHKVETTSQAIITYIKTEEGFFPRAGVIGLAGLTGIVLARKGGVFRKTIYSGGLMTATAALCYPYKAVQISQAEYNWVKDKLTTLYNSESSSKVSPSEEDKSKEGEETKSDSNTPLNANDTSSGDQETNVSISKGEGASPEKDFGQSNPADKDMYTTRS